MLLEEVIFNVSRIVFTIVFITVSSFVLSLRTSSTWSPILVSSYEIYSERSQTAFTPLFNSPTILRLCNMVFIARTCFFRPCLALSICPQISKIYGPFLCGNYQLSPGSRFCLIRKRTCRTVLLLVYDLWSSHRSDSLRSYTQALVIGVCHASVRFCQYSVASNVINSLN